ncbi:plasmid mobilization protein [Anaerobutyricum soehngenii]|uniref:plasmid mobilization protein n=1 Tax=Anaerobutyricum soehngenii TaxID=105843 RepID=UPI001C11155C|nr:plasmid mobilization relaxosome protein MobC [Anaerobutyricum soehngenii]MBU5415533.1 MobC family plasmid mobilization relaxosome protein [Anaerobutyricum soehngenii]
MTRPKKEKTLTKTKDVHLRMNETEYTLLIERARASDMTVSEFVRNALNNQNVIIKYEITADVPEIKQLISQFGKIGNNLNQIARYFNQGGIISSEMKKEIRKALRDIYEMKYEVEKMVREFRGEM